MFLYPLLSLSRAKAGIIFEGPIVGFCCVVLISLFYQGQNHAHSNSPFIIDMRIVLSLFELHKTEAWGHKRKSRKKVKIWFLKNALNTTTPPACIFIITAAFLVAFVLRRLRWRPVSSYFDGGLVPDLATVVSVAGYHKARRQLFYEELSRGLGEAVPLASERLSLLPALGNVSLVAAVAIGLPIQRKMLQ